MKFLSPRKHDELMSLVLGLPHFISLVAGKTLAEMDIKKLKSKTGPTFELLFSLIKKVVSQSPNLLSHLQITLPQTNEIENNFQKNTSFWQQIIKTKKKKNSKKNC